MPVSDTLTGQKEAIPQSLKRKEKRAAVTIIADGQRAEFVTGKWLQRVLKRQISVARRL